MRRKKNSFDPGSWRNRPTYADDPDHLQLWICFITPTSLQQASPEAARKTPIDLEKNIGLQLTLFSNIWLHQASCTFLPPGMGGSPEHTHQSFTRGCDDTRGAILQYRYFDTWSVVLYYNHGVCTRPIFASGQGGAHHPALCTAARKQSHWGEITTCPTTELTTMK